MVYTAETRSKNDRELLGWHVVERAGGRLFRPIAWQRPVVVELADRPILYSLVGEKELADIVRSTAWLPLDHLAEARAVLHEIDVANQRETWRLEHQLHAIDHCGHRIIVLLGGAPGTVHVKHALGLHAIAAPPA